MHPALPAANPAVLLALEDVDSLPLETLLVGLVALVVILLVARVVVSVAWRVAIVVAVVVAALYLGSLLLA